MDKPIEKKPVYYRYRWHIAGCVAFVILLVYVSIVASGGRKLRTEADNLIIGEAQADKFMEYVDVEGVVQPILTIKINAREAGSVERIVAEEGTMMEKGDTILTLTNPDLIRTIDDQRDEWEKQLISFQEKEIEMEQKSLDLQKLQYVGVLAFATVDGRGAPQVRNISAIHYEPDAIYFFTARGKDFCRQLLADGRVQVLGYTRYKEMIRLTAAAETVPQKEQARWIETIFAEQPYLANVYPGDTRNIGIVFAIRRGSIEYFDLGVHPIFRESYSFGGGQAAPKGYQITESCIGCGACAANCPQGCITPGQPYAIRQQNCLHCGSCFEHCPVSAVRPKEA